MRTVCASKVREHTVLAGKRSRIITPDGKTMVIIKADKQRTYVTIVDLAGAEG